MRQRLGKGFCVALGHPQYLGRLGVNLDTGAQGDGAIAGDLGGQAGDLDPAEVLACPAQQALESDPPLGVGAEDDRSPEDRCSCHGHDVSRWERRTSGISHQLLSKFITQPITQPGWVNFRGDTQDAAKIRLTDKALLQRFEDVAHLPDDKKAVVMEVLDAFLALNQLKNFTNRQAS
jgi:hypothetical protein